MGAFYLCALVENVNISALCSDLEDALCHGVILEHELVYRILELALGCHC